MNIPKSHPRYQSLRTRALVEQGVANGITSPVGLIAHGRGEAFDYLIEEQTQLFAKKAIEAAARLLLHAKHPVISVNGNTAALVPEELIALAAILNAPLEINLFYGSDERVQKIKTHLLQHGATNVLLPDKNTTIDYLDSNRKYVNPEGIKKADVVFVPLEDGDRTEALIKSGKTVITVDLNPLSRTAQKATVTIVDNIIRSLPLLIDALKQPARSVDEYNNKTILAQAAGFIAKRFSS